MQDFRNLDVWKRAHQLVLAVYRAAKDMPRDEVFGVTMQMRRAALNIATRIAEGCGRSNNAEFIADLRRSSVHAHELEYTLIVALDLGYIAAPVAGELTKELVEVRKMLHGFLHRLITQPPVS